MGQQKQFPTYIIEKTRQCCHVPTWQPDIANLTYSNKKSDMYYDESMENPIVSEVATISDNYNDINKPISKQTGLNTIWSSLIGIPRNPSTS